jgi:Rrf2 family cysteine metabolism transcriptional repressor
MRVSAKAEFACLAMFELAANYDSREPVRVKAIADTHGIPQRFLVQILLQLKGAGLVVSLRGASGGYQLARRPEEISLADVIHTIEPPVAPEDRRVSPKRRATGGTTASPAAYALRSVWRDIQAEEERLLGATTLAELLRRTQHDSLMYQI